MIPTTPCTCTRKLTVRFRAFHIPKGWFTLYPGSLSPSPLYRLGGAGRQVMLAEGSTLYKIREMMSGFRGVIKLQIGMLVSLLIQRKPVLLYC